MVLDHARALIPKLAAEPEMGIVEGPEASPEAGPEADPEAEGDPTDSTEILEETVAVTAEKTRTEEEDSLLSVEILFRL